MHVIEQMVIVVGFSIAIAIICVAIGVGAYLAQRRFGPVMILAVSALLTIIGAYLIVITQ